MKLLVVDSNSILNRAFYGIKLLSPKNGAQNDDFYDSSETRTTPAKKKPALQAFDDDGDIPF